jgi:hypothetical protein
MWTPSYSCLAELPAMSWRPFVLLGSVWEEAGRTAGVQELPNLVICRA